MRGLVQVAAAVAVLCAALIIPGDAAFAQFTVTDGTGCVMSTGLGESVICCNSQTYSCEGALTGSHDCGAPPDCGRAAVPGECGVTVTGSGCDPEAETCPPPDDASTDDSSLGQGCASPKTPFAGSPEPGHCGGEDRQAFDKLGGDPILASPRAAATTPFTDFSVGRVSRLSLTRMYNSSGTAAAASGSFGTAWYHDWDAYLTCHGAICTVRRGALGSFRFSRPTAALSPDGNESWTIYRPYSSRDMLAHHHLLVRRPSGVWTVFMSDGRELDFAQACGCGQFGGAFCTAAEDGGRARLTRVVDPAGNVVAVSYDPAGGVLLRLTDDLQHSLELRGAASCGAQASELRYDGGVVARYIYANGSLVQVTDGDGRTMRSYAYGAAGPQAGRLQAVLNESGGAIAQFTYDAEGRAVGLVDSESDIAADYKAYCILSGLWWEKTLDCFKKTGLTEHHRGLLGDTSSTSWRTIHTQWRMGMFMFEDGTLTDQCSCTPSGTGEDCSCGWRVFNWTPSGAPKSSIAQDGQVIFREFDAIGRVTRRVETQTTPGSLYLEGPLPDTTRDEYLEYGVTRIVAQGVTLDLDMVTKVRGPSSLQSGGSSEVAYDYDQAPSAIDPPGYACAATSLPAGSVLCRQIESGYVTVDGVPAMERHATFHSYDSRGRRVRTYGPIQLDRPSAADVTPIEERSYWSDGASPERQGRLSEVKRYSTPTGTPLAVNYDYGALGVSEIVAPDGTIGRLTRDGRGRPTLVSRVDAGGATRAELETRYYDENLPRLRILPGGAAERYGYDGKGRLSRVELLSGDPEAAGANPAVSWSESYQYDQAGNVIHAERTDAAGHVTWQQDRAYDAQHRVVWESHPSLPSAGRRWSYTAFGALTRTEDEEGRATAFVLGDLDRVAKVQRSGRDGQGSPGSTDVAAYQYAPHQELLAGAVDGAGRTTSYRHDDFGRVEWVGSPNLSRGGGVSYRYDARGNVTARWDANVAVGYGYDGLDRLTSLQAANSVDGATVAYTYGYDASSGRLTSIAEPDRTTAFTYDWAGRVKSEVRYESGVAVPLTTAYDYDQAGRLQQVSYPSGLTVQLLRDPVTGEVTAVENAASGARYADGVTRYPAGPWVGFTFGNGRTLSQTVNLRYEPLSIQSGPLWLEYLPTPAGDIGAIVDRSEEVSGCVRSTTRSARYDFQDRLVGWSDAVADGPSVCPAESIGAAAARFTYVSGTDQIAGQQTTSGVPTFAYGYDAEGNVSAVGQYDGAGASIATAVCLRHDPLNRLVLTGYTGSTLTPGGTACATDSEVTQALARFQYDSRNRRVAKQVSGQWTHTVFDLAGNPLSELARTGDPVTPWVKVRDYVWLDGRLLAQVEYDGVGQGHVYYAHLDHLGMPRALTNANGQLVWSTFQRPNGEVGEKTVADPLTGSAVVTNVRLPGQYDERLFAAAGLGLQGPYYNWNRWYLPAAGRYLEADPIAMGGGFNGMLGADWYGYAGQNPMRWIDPSGEAGGPFVPEPPGGPPVPLPGGGPGNDWQWHPDPANGRGGSYGPKVPLPGQSQPSISWEPNDRGHWDMDDGLGNRQRFDRWGNPLTPEQAHKPRPWPGWLNLPTELMLFIFIDPCVIDPKMCERIRSPDTYCDNGA